MSSKVARWPSMVTVTSVDTEAALSDETERAVDGEDGAFALPALLDCLPCASGARPERCEGASKGHCVDALPGSFVSVNLSSGHVAFLPCEAKGSRDLSGTTAHVYQISHGGTT